MRGVGKTSLGKALAKRMCWRFFDMDHVFEQVMGTTIQDFVYNNSWAAFREKETELLISQLKEFPHRAVISCGGGIIESERAVNILKAYDGLVVQLNKPIKDITETIQLDSQRIALGESIENTWLRRKPIYESASNYEFVIPPDVKTPEAMIQVEKNLASKLDANSVQPIS